MLNRAKSYYENDKERLKKQARNKYRNLLEEDNKKIDMEKQIRQYVQTPNKEYQKNYREAKMSQYNNE